jgi:hypothetical protein
LGVRADAGSRPHAWRSGVRRPKVFVGRGVRAMRVAQGSETFQGEASRVTLGLGATASAKGRAMRRRFGARACARRSWRHQGSLEGTRGRRAGVPWGRGAVIWKQKKSNFEAHQGVWHHLP